MPRKPIELLSDVAQAFVRDMRVFFACGHDTIEANGIAVGTLHALKHGKLRLTDIKAMFVQMRDQV